MSEQKFLYKASNKNIFLKEISRINISKLSKFTEIVNVKAKEKIFKINNTNEYYYLIISGDVEILNSQNKSKYLTKFDSFGDECLIGLPIALSTAIAKTDCKLYRFKKEHIDKIKDFDLNLDVINKNFLQNTSDTKIAKEQKAIYSTKSNIIDTIGWLSSFFIPLILIYFMQGIENPLDKKQSLLLFIFLSTIMMWILHLVQPFIPAIYLLIGMVLLSLAPNEIILSGFYSNTFFLMIALSTLGITIKSSGISYRILLYLYKFNLKSKAWRQFVILISGFIITPIIPSTNGRVFINNSLFLETLELFNIKRKSKEYQRLIASSIGGISLLSPIFLTSKSINLLAFGMMPEQDQQIFQFFYWLVASSVVGIILLLSYLLLTWLMFRNDYDKKIDYEKLKNQSQILGKFTMKEFIAIGCTIFFMLIVFTKNIHNLNTSWLAMLLTFFLLLIGVFQRKEFNTSIEWDFLIILSSLLGFSQTMQYLELDLWIIDHMSWLIEIIKYNFIKFIIYLSLIIFILRLLIPINGVVIIMCSILIPVSTSISISSWVMVFLILLMSESYTYKASASYILNFYNLIDDNYSYWRLILLQILLYLLKIVAVIATIPFWQYLGIL